MSGDGSCLFAETFLPKILQLCCEVCTCSASISCLNACAVVCRQQQRSYRGSGG